MFTARYGLSPYITEISLVFKMLIIKFDYRHLNECVCVCVCVCVCNITAETCIQILQ